MVAAYITTPAGFLIIVLLSSFILNFYVLWRLCGLFSVKRGVIFWTVVFICSTSLFGYHLLHYRFIYIAATWWLGIVWLLFSTLLVYEIVRLFIKIKPFTAGIAVLIIAGLATICAIINAQFVHVKEIVIPGNVNINIVQLSDIHLGMTSEKFFQKVIERTNALEPNLIVITGDIVDMYNEDIHKSLQKLKDLKADPASPVGSAATGVFFVTGNHEMYSGSERTAEALIEANVKVLRNQLADCNEIQIIGIDESTDLQDVGWIVERLNRDKSKFCVLLSHRPISPKELCNMGIELGLSGHLHDGQIFPFNYVVRLFQKYMAGLYKEDGSYLYVTTGTGTWGPRMRLGSRNEIVLIKIRKTP